MLAGHSHKLLEQAARESIERIQMDRRKAPQRLKPLLAYIEENLFNPTLDVNQLKRSCGVRDNSVPIQFHSAVGRPPHGYIEDRRLETACRLLADTHLKIWQISELLGYSSIQVFSRAFSRWSGQRPTLFRKKARRGGEMEESNTGDQDGSDRKRFDRSIVATESLRKALDGELPHDEAKTLIKTLLDLYPSCRESSDGIASELTDEPNNGDGLHADMTSESARQDAESAQLRGNAHDRYQAETIWNRLKGLPSERQHAILAESSQTSAALFYLLLDKSREIGAEDVSGGVEVAETALASLDALVRREGDEQTFACLCAQGWTRLANARCLASNLTEAEAGFEEAENHLKQGGCRPEIEAELLTFKATLRRDQRQFLEARELLDRARGLCPEEATDLQIKVMLAQASVRFEEGHPAAAIPFLEEALPLVKASQNNLLRLAVSHNLVATYAEAGWYDKALHLLPMARKLSAEHGTSYSKIRSRWLEGLVSRGLGDFETAEEALVTARDAFSETGDGFSTALVCLDIAELYSRQGRYADLIALCASMAPISGMLQHHREAIVALQLFQRAAEERSVTNVVVERARKALLRGQKRAVI